MLLYGTVDYKLRDKLKFIKLLIQVPDNIKESEAFDYKSVIENLGLTDTNYILSAIDHLAHLYIDLDKWSAKDLIHCHLSRHEKRSCITKNIYSLLLLKKDNYRFIKTQPGYHISQDSIREIERFFNVNFNYTVPKRRERGMGSRYIRR